jgi:hypothetical protein
MLKEEDYNPVWRDRLAAISHRLTTRVDIRRLYRMGSYGVQKGTAGAKQSANGDGSAMGEAERHVYDGYRDLGYTGPDAERLADFTAREWEKSQKGNFRKRHGVIACRKYQTGLISRSDLLREWVDLGLPRTDIAEMINICDAERVAKQYEIRVKMIRRLYLRGQWSELEVRGELGKAGMLSDRVDETLETWKLERLAQRREASVQQMCQWVAVGLMSKEEMEVRAKRLGYSQTDAERIRKHCVLGNLAKDAKDKERLLRYKIAEERREAKVREQIARAKEAKEASEAKAELSGRTEANMRRWWKLGILTPDEITDTLNFRGWLPSDIKRWLIANEPTPEKDED